MPLDIYRSYTTLISQVLAQTSCAALYVRLGVETRLADRRLPLSFWSQQCGARIEAEASLVFGMPFPRLPLGLVFQGGMRNKSAGYAATN